MLKKAEKRFFSLLLSICLVIVMIPWGTNVTYADAGVYTGNDFVGSGTTGDPYQIGNQGDLETLSGLVNTGGYGFANTSFIITQNITMTGDFTPIGNETNPFQGSINGDQHTISNLQVPETTWGGLIGYGENITLKQILLSGASVVATSGAGVMVGYANQGLIFDCHVLNSTVNTSAVTINYAGGIVGLGEDTPIAMCSISGSTVTALNPSASTSGYSNIAQAGGIAGKTTGIIEECTVTGSDQISILGTNFAGGLAGTSSGDVQSSQVNCTVSGIVVGGLVGFTESLSSNPTQEISNCEYSGIISSVETGSSRVAGGLVGKIQTKTSIDHCVVYGEVVGKDIVGGVVGNKTTTSQSTFKNNVSLQTELCINNSVTAFTYMNRFIGHTSADYDTYQNNYGFDTLNMVKLTSTSTSKGKSLTTMTPSAIDTSFWNTYGFDSDSGWDVQTSGLKTAASAEVHRASVSTKNITISGNAVPYYAGKKLEPNQDGTYTVFEGMEVLMMAASGYTISQVSQAGSSITAAPWSFAVSASTNVVTVDTSLIDIAQTPEALFWYQGKYVQGHYGAATQASEIDWATGISSSVTPIAGTYTDMNLYILEPTSHTYVDIGALDLGSGSVICTTSSSSIYLTLRGDRTSSTINADSIDTKVNLTLEDMTVQCTTINTYRVTFENATNTMISGSISEFYGMEVMGTSSVTINGELTGAWLDVEDTATLHTTGNLNITSWLAVYGDSNLQVDGNLVTNNYLALEDTGEISVLGNVELGNSGADLDDSSVLNVVGRIYFPTSTSGAIHLQSTTAVLLNAAANSAVPMYQSDGSDMYLRTTLTGLPASAQVTITTIDTSNNTDMAFQANTDANGSLTAWLRKTGDAVIVTKPDSTTMTAIASLGASSNGSSQSSGSGSGSGGSHSSTTNTASQSQVSGNTTVVTGNGSQILSGATRGETIGFNLGSTLMGEFRLAGNAMESLGTMNTTLQFQSGATQYDFPLSGLDFNGIRQNLNIGEDEMENVEFDFAVSTLTGTEAESAQVAAEQGGFTLLSPTIDFSMQANLGTRSLEVSRFTRMATRRMPLTMSAGTDKGYISGFTVGADGKLYHAPTKTYYDESGNLFAEVNAPHNSVYGVGYREITFTDAENKWYEDVATEMASRGILNGRSDGTFDGNTGITRAEFTSMLTGALGLIPEGSANYTDISESDWYYGAIGMASEYGLVSGRSDGSFDPNAKITRQEAMVMIARGAKLAEYEGSGEEVELSVFADISLVKSWSEESVGFNVGNGLIVGSGNLLRPADTITRAESATVILRLLQKSGLIDVKTEI